MSTYLDPVRILRYAAENPRRALKIAAVGLFLVIVMTVSAAVEAVPVWIAGYALGVAVLGLGYREMGRLKLLRAADEDDAGALTPGATKVHGTVVQATDKLVETPSGIECVAYEYEKVRSSSGQEGHHRQTETDAVPFYVEDGSGRALVDPHRARIELKEDEGSRSTLFGNRSETESSLQPGDTVAVYGEGVRPDVSYDGSSVADGSEGASGDGSVAGSDSPQTAGRGQPTGGSGGQPASARGQPAASGGQPASSGGQPDVDTSQFTPFPDEMDIPPEHLPEGVDSPEELIDEEDMEPLEDMPPQYQEFYREQLQQGGFPGPGGVLTGAGGSGGESDDGGVLQGMAETVSDLPERYAHLFAGEDLIVGSGTEYGAVVITDKGGVRMVGKQLLTTVGVLLTGLAIIAVSAAAMLGLIQLG